MEDTDQARSTPESEAAVLEDLKWIGIKWDEGNIRQMILLTAITLLFYTYHHASSFLGALQGQTLVDLMAPIGSLNGRSCIRNM